MAIWYEYTVNHYHGWDRVGGELAREGQVKYVNGRVSKLSVDPDKLAYWDLLGDVKELGYDIKKDVSLSYKDGV